MPVHYVEQLLVGVKNSEPAKDAEGFRHDYVLVGNRVTGLEAAFVLSGTKEAFLAWARDQVRGLERTSCKALAQQMEGRGAFNSSMWRNYPLWDEKACQTAEWAWQVCMDVDVPGAEVFMLAIKKYAVRDSGKMFNWVCSSERYKVK